MSDLKTSNDWADFLDMLGDRKIALEASIADYSAQLSQLSLAAVSGDQTALKTAKVTLTKRDAAAQDLDILNDGIQRATDAFNACVKRESEERTEAQKQVIRDLEFARDETGAVVDVALEAFASSLHDWFESDTAVISAGGTGTRHQRIALHGAFWWHLNRHIDPRVCRRLAEIFGNVSSRYQQPLVRIPQ